MPMWEKVASKLVLSYGLIILVLMFILPSVEWLRSSDFFRNYQNKAEVMEFHF